MKDENFSLSSHLHFDFFSFEYLQKLIDLINEKIENKNKEKVYLEQWNSYFVNPTLLFKLFNNYI